jgi:hypothetical protein
MTHPDAATVVSVIVALLGVAAVTLRRRARPAPAGEPLMEGEKA